MLCFLYSFFNAFFSIWSPFWLHFGIPKATLELSKSIIFRKRIQGGLQGPFGSIWEPKVNSKKPFGSILKPCGSILDGFWDVWGRFLEGFGAQPSAQKYAVESLSQVGGIGRKAPTIRRASSRGASSMLINMLTC